MASQRPPAWFRLSAMRGAAPPPAPAAPPPAPVRPPAVVRPAIPMRPPPPPTQTRESAPSSPPPAASLPPTAPPSPPALARSPVAAPARPSSPVAPPPARPSSPVAPPVPVAALPPPPPPRSPVVPLAPQPSPPRVSAVAPPITAPAPKSPTPPPPTLPPSSPVTKSTLTTSTIFQQPSSSIPTSPQRKTQSPSSSKPTSPAAKPSAIIETVNGKAAAPVSSPNIVKSWEKSPAQSPTVKPLTHPPSPLTLPPPQIKTSEGESEPRIDQKNVLLQESIEKPMKTHNLHHNHGIASKGKREIATKDKGTSKKLSDSEELGVRVITIAGENKGALMEISSSHKKNHLVGKPHSLKKNGESGEEGKSNNKEKSDKATVMQSQPMTTFLNSNVQGINNSIVFNSTCHHNDPGVHLSLVTRANGRSSKD